MNHEIKRSAVMSRLGISDLRKFKRSTVFAMLRISEIKVTRQDVRYPQEKVAEAFRVQGLKWG